MAGAAGRATGRYQRSPEFPSRPRIAPALKARWTAPDVYDGRDAPLTTMSDTMQSTPRSMTRPRLRDAGPPNRNLLISLAAIAAIFLVGTVVMTLLAVSLAADLRAEREGRDAVKTAASRFGTAFLSYDGSELDAARRAVGTLATPKFRKEFERALDRVGPALEKADARARSTVTGVYVGTIEGGRASTVVTLDVVVRSTEVRQSAQRQILSIGLVKLDGDWRVNEVTDLRANTAKAAPTTP